MKLKNLVAAAGLAVAAPAFAAITPPADTTSELFLVVWEQGVSGKPDTSFTYDLGLTYAGFLASVDVSQTWATLTSANTTFFNFLASADAASLQYAVIGGKNTPSPATLLSTVHVGDESLVSQGTNGQITGALAQVTTFLSDVNTTGTHASLSNGQSVNATGDPAYFMDGNRPMYNYNGAFAAAPWSNSNLLGVASEFTSLSRVTGSTGLPGKETVLPGIVNFAQVGNDYVLSYTVAAVPEASSLGMALAGLGVLGFIGQRRRKQG